MSPSVHHRNAAEENPMACMSHQSKSRKQADAAAANHIAVGPASSHPSATNPRELS